MKVLYDGLSVTFTPETEADQTLLVGFTNLDAVIDSINDTASIDRAHQLTLDAEKYPEDAICALQDAVACDSMFDDPPEDEDDDDFPTPVPGGKK